MTHVLQGYHRYQKSDASRNSWMLAHPQVQRHIQLVLFLTREKEEFRKVVASAKKLFLKWNESIPDPRVRETEEGIAWVDISHNLARPERRSQPIHFE